MTETGATYTVGQWVEFASPARTAQAEGEAGEAGETEGATPTSPADAPTAVGGDGVIVAVHPAPGGGFVYDIALPGLYAEEVWPLVTRAEAEILGLHPGHAAF